jgi:hypothetical protein
MRWLGLGLLGIGGAALGSFLVQVFLFTEQPETNWYVERRFDFGRYGSANSITGDGWNDDEEAVTWMSKADASLEVPVEKESDRLILILRGKISKSKEPTVFELHADKTLIQEWSSKGDASSFERIFKIPRAATRAIAVPLRLRSRGEARLGLTALELIESNEVSGYKSTLDNCSRTDVQGWAAADGMASSVSVLIDDRPAQGRLSAVERRDLVRAKLPGDAGFKFTFAEPVAPGSRIQVVQANGRRASRSPCTVK